MADRGPCKVPGCDKPHKSFGYCNKHYRRFKVHGDPLKVLVDHNMAPGESLFNWLFYTYRKNAEKRNLSFSLEKEYFRQLTKRRCFFCNLPPSTVMIGKNKKGSYIYNGIDRLDSSKGYEIKNCVTCCHTCNLMKGTISPIDFLTHIHMIHEHSQDASVLESTM